jgi:Ni/Fe-hydrogenase subunit HybB-like protein
VYFFLTAVAAGLAMTVFESYQTSRVYGHPFNIKLLSSLTRAIPFVLGLYLVIKVAELLINGNFRYLLMDGMPAFMYVIEMVGGVLIPILFFADPKTRNDQDGITWAAFFTMGGLILNRINSALAFMDGALYFPSLAELAVSVGLTCLGIIMFDAAVRFLPILPEPKNLNKPKTEKENSYA